MITLLLFPSKSKSLEASKFNVEEKTKIVIQFDGTVEVTLIVNVLVVQIIGDSTLIRTSVSFLLSAIFLHTIDQ